MSTKKDDVGKVTDTPNAPKTPGETGQPMEGKKSIITKSAGSADGFCVYLGPSITGVIQSGTIYPGTVEQALKRISSAVKMHPLIASLVVEGKALPEDRIKVKTAGNLLNVNYTKLASGKS